MRINNSLSLFFFTSVFADVRHNAHIDRMDQIAYRRFLNLERKADAYLKEWHYWLGGKSITILEGEVSFTSIRRDYRTVSQKMYSLAKAFFYFLPGVLIKTIAWGYAFSHVKQRNKHIFKLFKQELDFAKKCASTPHYVVPKKFKSVKQNTISNIVTSKDLQFHIVSFLNDKELGNFARTSTFHHCLAAQFFSNPANQCRNYPHLITQGLGIEKIVQLPCLKLPPGWN